jgi:hypothetical protein
MPHAAHIHFGCHPVQFHVPIFAIWLGPRLRLRLTRRLGLRLTLRLRLRLGLGLTLRLGLRLTLRLGLRPRLRLTLRLWLGLRPRLTLRLGLRFWRQLWPKEIPDTLHVIIEGPSRRHGEV